MKRFLRGILALALQSSVALGNNCDTSKSVRLDLKDFFNNKAFGSKPGEADFDSKGSSYPVPDFINPSDYKSSVTGIRFSFPGYVKSGANDNIICDGQVIDVPKGNLFSASFLLSNDKELATVSKNVTFTYEDGSTSLYNLRTLAWFNLLTINRGEIIFPKRFTSTAVNWNTSHIFERTAALDPGKKLKTITLPTTTNTTEGRMHVFAISLHQGSEIGIQSVRGTQKWADDDQQSQLMEVTINNAGSECVSGDGIVVKLEGHDFEMKHPGSIKRLCPGDQKVATIAIEPSSSFLGQVRDSTVKATVEYSGREQVKVFKGVKVGLREWTSDLDNLAEHEAPDWFKDNKFGIMIHWGPYSVPGWGNSSEFESYSEWFWWYSTNPLGDRSNFRGYRLETFGEDWAYDDSFEAFTGERFDSKEWVDLFDDAGARYFVITTKHHDGFALWDTKETSNRSALHYGPQRDVLKELFDAAATYHPNMKRGTYFSLPEWFNPDFGVYGFDQFNKTENPGTVSWPGDLATNPYTGEKETYTGHIPVGDFIQDLMVPQMEQLAYDYGTDIMWCDCGAANGTAEFAAKWFNQVRQQNRHVAINSRCGVPQAADFDTPEYQTFSSAQHHKWESSQGMDPYSYGYNRATPEEAYMNASTIIKNLVDMVSKNGNFLLDIGPRADGTIVEQAADNLREAGKWIKRHQEAIFNTTYWFIQSELEGSTEARFTQTDDAFYILFLDKPIAQGGFVVIQAPIPVLIGDDITLLGGSDAVSLDYEISGDGSEKTLRIKIGEKELEREEFCWVFKIQYQR
ncbi:unnamed protein product [Clonostachys byssicola]|uniref:alpha-L-fucosidase n=1 Tax=Clonostachys byssicola TaxID=160290 RepID=A0A9N9UM68_9HYPO|nr:unnamed protein product [Clonostachys byssicola]